MISRYAAALLFVLRLNITIIVILQILHFICTLCMYIYVMYEYARLKLNKCVEEVY